MRQVGLTLVGLTLVLSAMGAEPPVPATKPAQESQLIFIDEAGDKHVVTTEDFAKLPQRKLEAKDHSGANSVYEGVALEDLLRHVGVKFGKDLRGQALANTLLVEAADKYRASFALPEIDSFWTDDVVLVATRKGGELLPNTHGPYLLVAPHDKRHGRWVKQVVRLKLVVPPES